MSFHPWLVTCLHRDFICSSSLSSWSWHDQWPGIPGAASRCTDSPSQSGTWQWKTCRTGRSAWEDLSGGRSPPGKKVRSDDSGWSLSPPARQVAPWKLDDLSTTKLLDLQSCWTFSNTYILHKGICFSDIVNTFYCYIVNILKDSNNC